ncbi:NAD(P)/FAD-dependent oxidoreductase [Brevibacillus ruminantium]|uniref:NAD(P)/FAD-dependent oxidoreductase n=1 Tax=Brevibacillus ruminantium TaxID=2950604 RepID=A0ABY4WNZ6_9BACL|nr:NAD(P)/FAD-dependent oxidoreductase [Brevibacillus ruminantium]USG67585.1 NAD(P)/FAD-dependent oxidoreductase [Brevibacillus ruminantium]
MEHIQVLIVGGGIAGMSAAIWCERLGLRCVLIEREEQLGGQLSQIRNAIWDFPPGIYPDGEALRRELLSHPALQKQSIRLGESLTAIDPSSRTVTTSRTTYRVDYLIIATGVSPNEIPALDGCSRLLSPWFSTTAEAKSVAGLDVAVIGGGDRAAESVHNLIPHARAVYLLVRRNHLRARAQWAELLEGHPSLQIFWETNITDYREEGEKVVLTLHSPRANVPASLHVDRILPRIGVHANLDGLDQFLGINQDGYLLAGPLQQTEGTGSSWIYAVGDVTNGAEYASLSLAIGQAMKAVKHISLQVKEQ